MTRKQLDWGAHQPTLSTSMYGTATRYSPEVQSCAPASATEPWYTPQGFPPPHCQPVSKGTGATEVRLTTKVYIFARKRYVVEDVLVAQTVSGCTSLPGSFFVSLVEGRLADTDENSELCVCVWADPPPA